MALADCSRVFICVHKQVQSSPSKNVCGFIKKSKNKFVVHTGDAGSAVAGVKDGISSPTLNVSIFPLSMIPCMEIRISDQLNPQISDSLESQFA